MMKKVLIIVLGAFVLASCRSSKKMAKDEADVVSSKVETVEVKQKQETIAKADKKAPAHTNICSKVRVKISADGKDLSTNGQLKMKWNDVIQISLVDPLLGMMEIGKMEISTDSVFIMDRVNKRYISETYKKLSTLTGFPITFESVQNLFWEQVQKTGDNGTVSYTLPLAKPITIDVRLGDLNYESGWNGHTTVSSKYQKVSIEALFKAMLKNE